MKKAKKAKKAPKKKARSLVAETLTREAEEPLQKRAEEKLEAMLAAAADLIARQGFAKTSIRDLARETGCSVAGMYYYFKSKEELLYQIQFHTFGALLAEQEACLAGGGKPQAQLECVVRNHLSYFAAHPNELKVCSFEFETISGKQFEAVQVIRRRYFKLVAEVVGELTGRNTRRAADRSAVRHATLFTFSVLNWVYMWFDAKKDGPLDKLRDEMIAFILAGLKSFRRK